MSDEPTYWDAPNQQVVRRDASAPWEEGDGGPPGDQTGGEQVPVEDTGKHLDAMTKDELLIEAEARGVDVDPSMTKAEIREAIGS